MISRFKASNFTVFTELNVEFTPGINYLLVKMGQVKHIY